MHSLTSFVVLVQITLLIYSVLSMEIDYNRPCEPCTELRRNSNSKSVEHCRSYGSVLYTGEARCKCGDVCAGVEASPCGSNIHESPKCAPGYACLIPFQFFHGIIKKWTHGECFRSFSLKRNRKKCMTGMEMTNKQDCMNAASALSGHLVSSVIDTDLPNGCWKLSHGLVAFVENSVANEMPAHTGATPICKRNFPKLKSKRVIVDVHSTLDVIELQNTEQDSDDNDVDVSNNNIFNHNAAKQTTLIYQTRAKTLETRAALSTGEPTTATAEPTTTIAELTTIATKPERSTSAVTTVEQYFRTTEQPTTLTTTSDRLVKSTTAKFPYPDDNEEDEDESGSGSGGVPDDTEQSSTTKGVKPTEIAPGSITSSRQRVPDLVTRDPLLMICEFGYSDTEIKEILDSVEKPLPTTEQLDLTKSSTEQPLSTTAEPTVTIINIGEEQKKNKTSDAVVIGEGDFTTIPVGGKVLENESGSGSGILDYDDTEI